MLGAKFIVSNIPQKMSKVGPISDGHTVYGYLSSNTLIDLKKNRFEIRGTVLSFNHSERYDQKRQKTPNVPRRPYPEGQIGWLERGVARGGGKGGGGEKAPPGAILVPSGFPANPQAYHNKCLIVAFTMAKLIQENAYQGLSQYKTTLRDMKCLSGQIKKTSLRKQNEVGKKVLDFMHQVLDPLTIAWEGPHQWQDLDRICTHYKVQAVVFCQVMGNQPMYFFPSSKTQHNPKWPTLYFRENANPESHLDVIISPQSAYPYKFACRFCNRMITSARAHKRCARKFCFFFL